MSLTHDSNLFESLDASSIDINGCGLLSDIRFPSPSFPRIPPHDMNSRPSSNRYFESLPFDLCSPHHFESSSATPFASVLKRQPRSDQMLFGTPNTPHLESISSAFLDDDDFEQSLLPSTRNVISKKTQPFDQPNPLSFNFAVGVDVLPNDSDMDGLVFSESEACNFEHQPIRDDQDESANVVLHFKKVVSGKKPKLSGFTESLYDIRRPAVDSSSSSISSCPLLDLGLPLDVASFMPSPTPSSTGRSRISKLQHEVLNTWFYSHLDHPYPSDQEKSELCKAARLNEKQVMNWFVNNRKRVWQPMKREQGILNTKQTLK